MHYYGTRLSENISRREPEGYLLCLNVPVARTGTQEYLPEELGLPASPAMVPVYRPEEEVFSPETMASFEGMPVTNDHPPEGVDVSNIRALQKGHTHNVRRGSGEESDLLLADLIITDPGLIALILEEGKREISCGYTYELCEENGQYFQRQIRGNHVAVVDAGRAGPRVCIKDHAPNHERSTLKMKKSLMKKLVRMARDGDVEAIEAVAEIVENLTEPEVVEVVEPVPVPTEAVSAVAEPAAEDPAVVVETPETFVTVDEGTLSGIIERLDQIIALLTPAAADESAEDPAEDPVEEIVEAVSEAVEETAMEPTVEEILENEALDPSEIVQAIEAVVDPVVAEVLETEGDAECGDPESNVLAADALRAALGVVRPMLAKLPRKQRQKVAADIAARVRKSGHKAADTRGYAALKSVRAKASTADASLGKQIMTKRNANYQR